MHVKKRSEEALYIKEKWDKKNNRALCGGVAFVLPNTVEN